MRGTLEDESEQLAFPPAAIEAVDEFIQGGFCGSGCIWGEPHRCDGSMTRDHPAGMAENWSGMVVARAILFLG